MEKTGKKARGGLRCVAGTLENKSCSNNSNTAGINMHRFPANPKTNRQWTIFVRKHRPGFDPSNYSNPQLCSAHFEEGCYTKSLAMTLAKFDSAKTKRFLRRDAVPTVDVTSTSADQRSTILSERDKRMFLRDANTEVKTNAHKMKEGVHAERDDQVKAGKSIRTLEAASSSEILVESQSSSTSKSYAKTPVQKCEKCINRAKEIKNIARKYKRQNRKIARQKRKIKSQKNTINGLRKKLNATEEMQQTAAAVNNSEQYQYMRDTSEFDEDNDTESDDNEVMDEEVINSDHDDPEWCIDSENAEEYEGTLINEDNVDSDDNDDDDENESTMGNISFDQSSLIGTEPKFIVFCSMLLSLFNMFCFKCKCDKPLVTMKKNGTMVTITQNCYTCGPNSFVWKSQPLLKGRFPAGNLLLSFGNLMAGASISKLLLVFRHMGLSAYTARTYYYHQRKFIFPAVLQYWENYKLRLLTDLKGKSDLVWCGDGRFDSMGHCAKYGAYTMFCSSISKIVHFEIIQSNETKGSPQMELEGAQRCFTYLQSSNVSIGTFITDRHLSITKWMRESQPNTRHLFDVWHLAKSVTKKIAKKGKQKGNEIIIEWLKAIRNHLYWCAISTKDEFGELILAKWKSLINHVSNKHVGHTDSLFKKCAHEPLTERRQWIKIGTPAYDNLKLIITNTKLCSAIKMLSSNAQTSCLESFHSTLNQWHPKMLHFSWMGTYTRHALATLHFNENLQRKPQTSKDGKVYFKVSYPKYKLGEEVVRHIPVVPTYGYVQGIMDILQELTLNECEFITTKYIAITPQSLVDQFPDRKTKQVAIDHYTEKQTKTALQLFPPVEEQNVLKEKMSTAASTTESTAQVKRRAPPVCKKCKKPKKGHPKSSCPL